MSFKTKLYTLLTEDSTLQDFLGGTAENKKVFFHYSEGDIEKNLPCITYIFYYSPEQPNVIGKKVKDGILFLDIWSRENMDAIEAHVLSLIKDTLEFKGNVAISTPLFEKDTNINHQHITINILGG